MQHIGILAHSADGAALCFLEMIRVAACLMGEHQHPEISLSILPMRATLEQYESGKLMLVKAHLAATANRLASAGCDFFVCPDNTAHLALEFPGDPLPLPGLHIAEILAQRASAEGRKCVGVLGTTWTMKGPIYPAALNRYGVAMRTPGPADCKVVDDVIFDELCQGRITEGSRAHILRIIEDLKLDGCDAVALSCTELPLLITPEMSPIPLLNSTGLLARAAVHAALTGEAPHWRGGPVDHAERS